MIPHTVDLDDEEEDEIQNCRIGIGRMCIDTTLWQEDCDEECAFMAMNGDASDFSFEGGVVNPASGLFMNDGIAGFDSAGNTFGFDVNNCG